MDFETFKEKLAKDVKEALDSRTGESYEVEGRTVDKMNETYEALTVKPEDSIVGVNLNATALYKAYEDGTPYDSIVEGAVDIADNALDISPAFNLSSFTDYDKMKDTLAMEVVSAEKNAAILETVPHKNIEDMAVVYRFVLEDVGQGPSSILVTNQMIDNYGVTPEQLHEDAVKNAPEIRPMVIEGMAEVLAKQMGVEDVEMLGINMPPDQEQMYVASVEGNVHGAGVLAYQDFMDKAAERAGGEAVGLRWQDIDTEEMEIDVNHSLVYYPEAGNRTSRLHVSTPKTEAGTRIVPMLDVVKEAFFLEKEMQLEDGGLNRTVIDGMKGFIFKNRFGGVPNPQSINDAIERIRNEHNKLDILNAAKEGRTPLLIPHFTCYHLRHTFASRLCEIEDNPKVIQSVMGHKSVVTTYDIYADASPRRNKESFTKLATKLSTVF